MSRRMIGPGVWVDEGPSSVFSSFVGQGGTLVMGADTPAKTRTTEICRAPTPTGPCARFAEHVDKCRSRANLDHRTALRRKRKKPRPSRAYVPKCGVIMKLARKPCARRAGHADCHLDRLALDQMNERNRARRAA